VRTTVEELARFLRARLADPAVSPEDRSHCARVLGQYRTAWSRDAAEAGLRRAAVRFAGHRDYVSTWHPALQDPEGRLWGYPGQTYDT
jgi:hypothetical protein